MSPQSGTPECPGCGGVEFEDGFVETLGQNGVRWMSGPVKLNVFGGARKSRSVHHTILARACVACRRLEFYVGERTN
ncbi:hypothetical protein H181DRAFT_04144 [Streptomyces sp. WMMB 714]|jgi:hypothetical protein|uniref:Uncharacterized protein n=1 Tax=Streptomyces daqingensis TaxID=1472640 RepID=A0ABQ2MSM8_9ACTN|nr:MULTISPECIES: hypothetical protein [Streptomyces]GGO57077.1 hypothetical protein GCM10012287_52120 [Streptomyces daqingensis]SCK46510.1 hypothetical protein H181DRAFT_04144 [Streptomyces sp. WMMB 714]